MGNLIYDIGKIKYLGCKKLEIEIFILKLITLFDFYLIQSEIVKIFEVEN